MNRIDQRNKITLYSPEALQGGFWFYIKEILRDFPQANEIGFKLFSRDVKAQYRESFLGFLWMLFPPLVTGVTWIFLNSTNLVKVQETEIPYPLFVLIGTLVWQSFSSSYSIVNSVVASGKSLLTKLNFPREALLLKAFYQILLDSTVKLLPLIVVALFFDWSPRFTIFLFPVSLLGFVILGFSIGLISYPLSYFVHDIRRITPTIISLLMYITPVLYPSPKAGFFEVLFKLNPLTILMEMARDSFVGTYSGEGIMYIIFVLLFSLFLLLFGVVFYKITMPIIVERMGS